MRKRIVMVAAAAVAVAAAVAIAAAWRERVPSGPVETVTLSMKDYAFNGRNPTLRFAPGERVRFVVSNDEDTRVLHNFRIAGLGVPCGPPLMPGERRVVTVTMPRSPGEFIYTCCTHPGMGGRLVIAER